MGSMIGDRAADLVKELQRNADGMPPYNEESIRQVLEEVRVLFEQNRRDVGAAADLSEVGAAAAVAARHAAVERDRRCLLAYALERLRRLGRHRWQSGAVLTPALRLNVSDAEAKWFSRYNANLARFMGALGDGDGFDLTQHRRPPKTLFVQVRCIEDFGEIVVSDGTTVNLKKNSMHNLLRTDCETLIRQGVLQRVNL